MRLAAFAFSNNPTYHEGERPLHLFVLTTYIYYTRCEMYSDVGNKFITYLLRNIIE